MPNINNLMVFIVAIIVYFMIMLFNNKIFRWRYVFHTVIAMLPTLMLISKDWYFAEDDFQLFKGSSISFFLQLVIMVFIVLYIILDNNRKPYSEVLKKEIWREWSKFQKNKE